MKKNLAKQIAEATADSYSRSRFTDAGWRRIAQVLLDAGATAAEAEWVLNSKHTRWAADVAGKNRGATAADFLNYAVSYGGMEKLTREARNHAKFDMTQDELRPATAGFTPTASGADLAGACEGEQIAMALDLLRVAANGGNIRNSAILLLAEIEQRAKGGR